WTIRESEPRAASPEPRAPRAPILRDVTNAVALPYIHHENDFVDFDREPLIPKLLSTDGPMLAVADVNGDGLDDMFIGGAKGQAGKLLIQQPDGRLVSTNERLFDADAGSEDIGAVFFDADGDGHPDLYVVSGGSEFSAMAPALQDRLYLNGGRGEVGPSENAGPGEERGVVESHRGRRFHGSPTRRLHRRQPGVEHPVPGLRGRAGDDVREGLRRERRVQADPVGLQSRDPLSDRDAGRADPGAPLSQAALSPLRGLRRAARHRHPLS